MQLEQPHLRKPFAALGAEKGPLSGVNALMSGQIPGVLEALVALLAGVRALARVRALVTGHIRGAGESFATLLARVRVGPVVDGERLWELGTLGLLLGHVGRLCGPLQSAVLLGVTVLDVLQQVGLLQVEERTLGAGEHLGGHLHSGTCAKHRKDVVFFVCLSSFHLTRCLPD